MADIIKELITISGLSFSYGERVIFDELDFALNERERIGLVGPNGSGKTTLFHILVGLIKPPQASLKIFAKTRRNEEDFAEVRRRVGFQFQDPDDQLFCPTVLEDIAFGPLNLGKTKEEVLAIVDRTLEAVGMTSFKERVTHHLSEGEKKLISLGTVLAMEPEIILLDEPTAGLDRKAEKRILEVLKSLPQTMMIISHNESFLDELTTSRVTIQKGKLRNS